MMKPTKPTVKPNKPGALFEKKRPDEKKNWIAGAIKKPGALRRQLHVKGDKPIPGKKLAAAAKKGGKEGKRARLAMTLKRMHKTEAQYEGSKLDNKLDRITGFKEGSKKDEAMDKAIAPALKKKRAMKKMYKKAETKKHEGKETKKHERGESKAFEAKEKKRATKKKTVSQFAKETVQGVKNVGATIAKNERDAMNDSRSTRADFRINPLKGTGKSFMSAYQKKRATKKK